MARKKRFSFGRQKPKDDQTPHDAAVATFPSPEPESNGAAGVPKFADAFAIKFSRVEREVTRHALNYYVANLLKKKKALREMGLATVTIEERISIIEGGNGLGVGIYSRLTEQLSIGDQAQLVLQDEQRAQEAEAIACRDAVLKLDAMPVGPIADQLLDLVRTWPTAKRTAAIEYATTVNALPEGEVFAGEVPSHIRVAVDRAIEWTMTAEDIEQYVAAGPWRTGWLEDDAKKVFHFAELPPAVEGEPATQGDHGLFETAPEARRCVARLNRQLAIEKNAHEPPAATE